MSTSVENLKPLSEPETSNSGVADLVRSAYLRKEPALVGVIEILKKRWPEAALVIVLQAGLMVLAEEISGQARSLENDPAALPPFMGFVLGAGTALFAVIWQMLYLGFLATACTEGTAPKQPGELVSVGRLFFWRMLRFQILWAVAYLAIAFGLLVMVHSTIFRLKSASEIPQWIWQLCSFGALAILIKPTLLGPAAMIVRDRMVLEALGMMREYKLSQAKGLVWAFFICFGAIFLLSSLQSLTGAAGVYQYVAAGISAIISSTLVLAVNLAAILFVAKRTNLAIEDTEESNGDEFTE
jgi:hypothetical protein